MGLTIFVMLSRYASNTLLSLVLLRLSIVTSTVLWLTLILSIHPLIYLMLPRSYLIYAPIHFGIVPLNYQMFYDLMSNASESS